MEDKELMTEIEKTVEEELYTESDVLDIVQGFINPIEVDLENIQGSKLDDEQFKAGLREASFVCGIASALKSVGFDNAQVFEYILLRENLVKSEIME